MEKKFFCVRGFMKSGTNWLGSLLSSHQQIDCVGEFHWQHHVQPVHHAIQTLPLFQAYPELGHRLRDEMEALTKRMLILHAQPEAVFIGDRTPHTIEPVVLRGCPHICIIRDGRDVLVSRAFHLFNRPESHRLFKRFPELTKSFKAFKEDPWFFRDNPGELLSNETMVRESARWWKQHLQKDSQAIAKYPGIPVHHVRYEDLHADVEAERQKLFQFLGANPDAAAKIEGDLRPGFSEERPDEFLRKGVVGDWKNYFTDDVKRWFKEEAGSMLESQKYAENSDW